MGLGEIAKHHVVLVFVPGWRVARHLGFRRAKRSFGHDASGRPGQQKSSLFVPSLLY
jgi:hypothetical protein